MASHIGGLPPGGLKGGVFDANGDPQGQVRIGKRNRIYKNNFDGRTGAGERYDLCSEPSLPTGVNLLLHQRDELLRKLLDDDNNWCALRLSCKACGRHGFVAVYRDIQLELTIRRE